ncbi:MAG: hypothetical protein P4L41_16730 [Flavipsychrobacter sp.]|nr:hypothetical protein [Flavipsychrobacter sp.]
MQNPYKRIYNLGFACYAVLALLAVIFYKERTIFTDVSFLLFNIIRTGSFVLDVTRLGAALTQVFPLLAVKASLSLNHVLLAYSLAFTIYYFTCYVICGLVLKRYDFALLILLLNILFVTDTFYWIISELPQGIVLMIVCFAYMKSSHMIKPHTRAYVLLSLGIVSVAFFHPLVIFPFYYTLVFLLLRNETPPTRKALYGAGILFLPVMAIKSYFLPPHDQQSIQEAGNLFKLFPHYLRLHSTKQFLHWSVTKYYWIPITAAANIIVLTGLRQWWKLLLFLLSGIYILLVNATYPSPDITALYMENLYLPIAVFIGLPFVFDVLPVLQKKKLAVPIVLVIIITGCIRIYNGRIPYVTQLNWERKYLVANGNRKLAVFDNCVPKDTLIMTWATPYEFWLLSTTEQHKTASIIVIDNVKQYDWAFGDKHSFIGAGQVFHYAELSPKYFLFTDSTTGYTLIK